MSSDLRKASEALGIDPPYSGPGAFRHHCSTWAVDEGCDRAQVREVLSHSLGTVTDRYVHSQAITIKRRVLEKVEGVFLKALSSYSGVTVNNLE